MPKSGTFHSLRLLKAYLQVYWLKPFDAVCDTANASALLQFDWSKELALEIGGGDGVFSFIMHGGEFCFLHDRYSQVSLSNKMDIYNFYDNNLKTGLNTPADFQFDVGVDLKMSHLLKGRQTGLYKNCNVISAKPEALPFKIRKFATVFLYTFHGLTDYRRSLNEIQKIIKQGGTLIMLVVNSSVEKNFICYHLSKFCRNNGLISLANYFLKLDSGRHDEIGVLFAKSFAEWKELLSETGFKINDVYAQVSPFLWRVYDTQTRPVFKALIRLNWLLDKLHLKFFIKSLWLVLWSPIIFLAFIIYAKPVRLPLNSNSENIFFAISASPVAV